MITRSTGALYGTDESTAGSTIASNGTSSVTQVDILGDDASTGWVDLYIVLVSGTPTAGSVDITISPRRVSGQTYGARSAQWSVGYSELTTNPKLFLGRMDARRYMAASIKNNATTATLGLSLLYELTKVT